MTWIEKISSFKYCGKPVTRHTLTCNTPFGQFKIYESVSGRTFVISPLRYKNHGDPTEEFSIERIHVKDLNKGKEKCETIWAAAKNAVNNV